VTRDGRTIAVTFHVPHPPLGWDETLAPPHQTAFTEWARGRGFEVATERGPLAIASVAIVGDAVVLTLAKAPADGPLIVRYAMLQDAQIASGGDEVGRRGQLRDSDPLVGLDAETIPCNVEQGSSVVTATEPGAFARRTLRDVAAGAGFAPDTIIADKPSDTVLTLTSPWTGPTGSAPVSFHYDQRNYAVAFQLRIP
jgi:hypothetical protein